MWSRFRDAIVRGRNEAERPDFAPAQNNLGSAYHALGRLPEARAAFEQALALQPDHAQAMANLGAVFRAQEDPVQARRWLEQAVRLDGKAADALKNLGDVCCDEGEFAAALDCYERALAANPESATTR